MTLSSVTIWLSFRILRGLDFYRAPVIYTFVACLVRSRNDLVFLLNPGPNLDKIVIRNSRFYWNHSYRVPFSQKHDSLKLFSGLYFQVAQVHPCLLFAVFFYLFGCF